MDGVVKCILSFVEVKYPSCILVAYIYLDVPHSAFALPDREPGDYVRMSIEVRAMVFSATET